MACPVQYPSGCIKLLDVYISLDFPGGASGKEPANAGDGGDVGSVPGWRRSPVGRHGSPLQYSCLANPMEREACQATVHGVAKSQT